MSEEVADFLESPLTSGYHIRLDVFEGPLDLLLHLIKENKMDIYNIPISQITDQYLNQIRMMEELNLDVAGEFLLMAATLAHIKSKMLVPPDMTQDDPEEEGKDPRGELVRRLLEYQKYKDAAERLFARPILFRDVFKREKELRPTTKLEGAPAELIEVSVFKLVDAFHKLLRNLELQKPHQVEMESVSVTDCAIFIRERICSSQEGTIRFGDLFNARTTKNQVVATFLAMLDMLKRGMLRVIQAEEFGEIHVLGTQALYGEWTDDGPSEFDGEPPKINN